MTLQSLARETEPWQRFRLAARLASGFVLAIRRRAVLATRLGRSLAALSVSTFLVFTGARNIWQFMLAPLAVLSAVHNVPLAYALTAIGLVAALPTSLLVRLRCPTAGTVPWNRYCALAAPSPPIRQLWRRFQTEPSLLFKPRELRLLLPPRMQVTVAAATLAARLKAFWEVIVAPLAIHLGTHQVGIWTGASAMTIIIALGTLAFVIAERPGALRFPWESLFLQRRSLTPRP